MKYNMAAVWRCIALRIILITSIKMEGLFKGYGGILTLFKEKGADILARTVFLHL